MFCDEGCGEECSKESRMGKAIRIMKFQGDFIGLIEDTESDAYNISYIDLIYAAHEVLLKLKQESGMVSDN